MKKAMKIGAIVCACAIIIALHHLWVTCPSVEDVDLRLWLGREKSGKSDAKTSESDRVLYKMGAHLLDPLFIYHNYGLFVLVEDEGHFCMIFLGERSYHEF